MRIFGLFFVILGRFFFFHSDYIFWEFGIFSLQGCGSSFCVMPVRWAKLGGCGGGGKKTFFGFCDIQVILFCHG